MKGKEEIVREFPPFGKYRVRMIRETLKDGSITEAYLDIREYISAETFEGFTRRGIKVIGGPQMELLRDVLQEILQVPGYHEKMRSTEAQIKLYREILEVTNQAREAKRKVDLFKEVMSMPKEEERKEVQMMTCTLCQREVPAASPQSGIGYKEETLCGVCLKAAQRVCPHALRKEDGVTCRDCGARPWSAGRVLKGTTVFLVKAAGGIAKVFVMYTIQALLGSVVTLGLAYLAAKHLGFLP